MSAGSAPLARDPPAVLDLETDDLVQRGDFRGQGHEELLRLRHTRGPGPEFEADERLVVLVEAGEDIALDVIPVQNRLEVGPDRHPCTALRLCGLGRWRVAPAAAGWTLSRWACIEPWTVRTAC